MRESRATRFPIFGTATVLLGATLVLGAEPPSIQWNEKAQSRVLNRSELAKLTRSGSKFELWQIKQVSWPTQPEIASSSVTAKESLRASCMGWLRKFMAEEYLPVDMSKNLIAMKNWGLIREESKQRRLCDVFVTRFMKDRFTIHIQESPGNVVVAVADEQLDAAANNHKDWVLQVAGLVLNKALQPEPDLNDVHVSESVSEGHKVSRVSWLVGSVTVRKGKRRLINGVEGARVGASSIKAATDGRFVLFSIPKFTEGPTGPDPYAERF